jgi:hypothetical protein
MGSPNMIDARRIALVAVFICQMLITLAFVPISGRLVLNLFHVYLQTILVMNLTTSVFIILDAFYILYVIRCRGLIDNSVHRSQVRE